jgi:hypothetical protein
MVMVNLDPRSISSATLIKANQLKTVPDDRMDRVPVFEVKKIYALPEYLRLMIHFDPEPLPGMQRSQPLLQFGLYVHRWPIDLLSRRFAGLHLKDIKLPKSEAAADVE